MELAQVLVVLWRRRGWVALGSLVALLVALSTAYSLGLFPPSLKQKSLALGVADTQLLVDTPSSTLLNAQTNELPMVQRAAVLAPLMTSLPVRQAIAQAAGIPVSAIYISAPLDPNGTIYSNEPNAAQRSQQLLGQNTGLRLGVQANANEPTIAINAQAANVPDAKRLANAAARGFIAFLTQSENQQRIPPQNRTVLRQLGSAEGGVVGNGINVELAIAVFFGVMVAWMALVVIASSVLDNLQAIRASGHDHQQESPELS